MNSIAEDYQISENREKGENKLFCLRQELKIYPAASNHDGSPAWMLCDPVRQSFYRIGLFEFTALSNWKEGVTTSELVEYINTNSSIIVDIDEITTFQKFLFSNNLLHITDEKYTQHLLQQARGASTSYFKQLLHHYLFFRIPLVKPDKFLEKTLPFAEKLYSRHIALFLLVSFMLGLFLVSRQWESFTDSFSNFASVDGVLGYGLVIVFVKIAHELGHAYTTKRYGLKVPTMGIAFMVMWPVLYTDTTDSWKLTSKQKRLNIVAAGMIVELSLAIVATLIWSFLPEGVLRSMVFMVATVSWVMTLAINLNPFMRFDGYYLLSDFLDTPNLQDQSFALAKWWLRNKLFGIGDYPDEWDSSRFPNLLIIYAICTWIYRAILFLGIAVLVYYIFFKPLGFFLMAVEIGVFIIQPIFREVTAWYNLRDKIRFNRETKRTAFLFSFLFLLFIVPWQQSVNSSALLRPLNFIQVYSPEPAQITQFTKRPHDDVNQGDVLIELESPELNSAYNKAALQVKMLSSQLLRAQTVEELIEFSELTSERLSEAQTELDSLNSRKQALRIKSNLSGKILTIEETLRKGRWVSNDFPLLQVSDDSKLIVETYVSEEVVSKLINDNARFYSLKGVISPLDARIVSIDAASSRELHSPWFAQQYGGDVPATLDAKGKLRTDKTVYRVILEPTEPITLSRMQRGVIRISTSSESIMGQFWRFALSVVMRESGF